MIGSYCPSPLQAQRGTPLLHVIPLSLEISRTICGVGQLPGQGFASPYRVVRRYTKDECGSAATAGSQSSVFAFINCSPVHPGAAAPETTSTRPNVPAA